MFPRLKIVRRLRPIDLVAPGDVRVRLAGPGHQPMPAVAPYVAVTGELRGGLTGEPTGGVNGGSVGFEMGGLRLAAEYAEGRVGLVVGTRMLRSRRFGRAAGPTEVGLSVTGSHVTAWVRENGAWVARARHDLAEQIDTHDEKLLDGLVVHATTHGPSVAGGFGQLGLRDTRIVTHADGTPIDDEGALWFTATSAGPGFFDTAHTSVWRFEPSDFSLTHTGDLFFRRPDRPGVYGDHATHLVRDGSEWLVATSTWGDFEQPRTRSGRRRPSTLRVTLADTRTQVEPSTRRNAPSGTPPSTCVRASPDLLHGTHVLDTRELPLPTEGLPSIATWDPHLLRRDGRWWVAYVSARRFFSFHPVLASGPSLEDLTRVGAASDRTATEGPTLLDVDGRLVVLASDGRDGRRGQRARFVVFDEALIEQEPLDAPYPTNLPWPTLARSGGRWLMLTFNGRARGERLLGYGTHGDLVILAESAAEDSAD